MAYAANLRGWGKGWPTDRSADMATVRAARSGAKFTIHKDIAPIVKYLIDEVERRGYLIDHGPADVDDDWSYSNRAIRGRNTPSNHSWGLAIDINAQDFPLGSSKRLPQWIVDLFTDMHFEYGGDWSGRKDPMHFEFAGSRGQAQWIVASLAGHAVTNTKPPVPSTVPPPLPKPPTLKDDEMDKIIKVIGRDWYWWREGGTGKSAWITKQQAADIQASYKKDGASCPLVQLPENGAREIGLTLPK